MDTLVADAPLARQAGARRLAVDLLGIAGLAFVGATATEVLTAPTFEGGALFAAHLILMGLALTGAALEWTRERLGEAVAVPALMFAVVLTLVDVVNGIWYFAPFLGLMTLFSIFGLVDRFMDRDEARHQPRVV